MTLVEGELVLRQVNWAGPCIEIGKVVTQSEKSWFYDYRVGNTGSTKFVRRRKAKTILSGNPDGSDGYPLHTTPCTRCCDHPQTTYPNGYDS